MKTRLSKPQAVWQSWPEVERLITCEGRKSIYPEILGGYRILRGIIQL